jgi:hypothetical protein
MNQAPLPNSRASALVVLGLAGITLYWTFTYSGPYRYFAELQIRWLGFYIPKLTALVVIVGLLVVGAVIKFVLKGAERSVPATPIETTALPAAATTSPKSWLRFVRIALPLIPLGMGGWIYFNGVQAGGLQELTAADFQSGKLQGRVVYADVRGHLGDTFLTKEKYLYFPMSSAKDEKAPVQLVVNMFEKDIKRCLHQETDGSFTVRGVVNRGLEGEVKYAFEKNGVAMGDPVWVIHAGHDPAGERKAGFLIMVVGILFAGFMAGLESFRKRNRIAAQQVPIIA